MFVVQDQEKPYHYGRVLVLPKNCLNYDKLKIVKFSFHSENKIVALFARLAGENIVKTVHLVKDLEHRQHVRTS